VRLRTRGFLPPGPGCIFFPPRTHRRIFFPPAYLRSQFVESFRGFVTEHPSFFGHWLPFHWPTMGKIRPFRFSLWVIAEAAGVSLTECAAARPHTERWILRSKCCWMPLSLTASLADITHTWPLSGALNRPFTERFIKEHWHSTSFFFWMAWHNFKEIPLKSKEVILYMNLIKYTVHDCKTNCRSCTTLCQREEKPLLFSENQARAISSVSSICAIPSHAINK
jgi:hypothetical protein